MPQRLRLAAVLIALVASRPAANAAEPPEEIRYTLRFPAPQTHYVEVEASIPTGGAPQVELMMAVWTPGSYLIREYARNVEGVAARSAKGVPLPWEKVRKNRWRMETEGAERVVVSYRVYGHEMSVQADFVDSGFALLNGAPTYLTLADRTPRPHDVSLVLPPGWLTTATGLPAAPDGQPHHYRAADYDTLVDSPIIAGNPTVHEFEVDGKKHYLVNEGEGGIWDGPRSARDVETIVRAQRDFWGSLPYDKYVFLNIITEARGGLEHKNSTVLMTSRWATRTRRTYLAWLELVSHEFFHTWNVKRLRPVELGPFDYENETPTKSLWVAEGVTDFYGRLLVHRAGLSGREEYLGGSPRPPAEADEPTGSIERVQTTPGRLVQPLESASVDAWIKFYRPDENTANTAINYYAKGSVVAFLLDGKIRRATDGAKCLDDVMRVAYGRYSVERGYTPSEFRASASEVAGIDLKDWFVKALETTDELDYSEALDWFGLRFRKKEPPKDDKPQKVWLGMTVRPEGGRLLVAQVRRGGPAFDSGFNVGDEILAIGDYRVRPEQWSARLEQYQPNEKVSVLVARRDHLQRLDTTFRPEPTETWKLEPNPDASVEQKARLKAWLGEAKAAAVSPKN
jgi:predicted metalloprotease with PDZ domain